MGEIYRYGSSGKPPSRSIFSLLGFLANPLRSLVSKVGGEIRGPKKKILPEKGSKFNLGGGDSEEKEKEKEGKEKKQQEKEKAEEERRLEEERKALEEEQARLKKEEKKQSLYEEYQEYLKQEESNQGSDQPSQSGDGSGPPRAKEGGRRSFLREALGKIYRRISSAVQNLYSRAQIFISQNASRLVPFGKQVFSSLSSQISGKIGQGTSSLAKEGVAKAANMAAKGMAKLAARALPALASGAAHATAGAIGGLIALLGWVGCFVVLLIMLVILILLLVMGAFRDFGGVSDYVSASHYVAISKSATVDGKVANEVRGEKTIVYTITIKPRGAYKLNNVKVYDLFEEGVDQGLINTDPKTYRLPSLPSCGKANTIKEMCFKIGTLLGDYKFNIEVKTTKGVDEKGTIINKARVEGEYEEGPVKKNVSAQTTWVINAGPTVILPNVPYVHEYYSLLNEDPEVVKKIWWSACGPASLTMALQYLTVPGTETLWSVIKKLPSDVYIQGDQTYNLTKGAAVFGKKAVSLERSATGIYKALKAGHPVILNVTNYNGSVGHYMVVVGIIGYDGKNARSLIIHDPGYDDPNGEMLEFPFTGPTKIIQPARLRPRSGPFTVDFGNANQAPFYVE
jgi:hypothetical protein